MKLTFICIVIVISCSVCACNNLNIYPVRNFNFEPSIKDVSDYDGSSYYPTFRYPYEKIPNTEDYEDPKIREPLEYEISPEKLQQYREEIEWKKSQLRQHRPPHRQLDVSLGLQYILEKLTKSKDLDLDIPKIPLTQDRNTYPAESGLTLGFDGDRIDDDFRKQTIPIDPMFEDDYGNNERLVRNNNADSDRNEESMYGMDNGVHSDDTNTDEFSSNKFKHVKVAKDPSEFAYLPSDSRFNDKVETSTQALSETPRTSEKLTKSNITPAEKFLVNPRSDQTNLDSYRDQYSKEGIEVVSIRPGIADGDSAGVYIIAIVAGISAAATVGLIAVGIGWYNLQKHVKNASDVEYPAYGVTGPNKDISPSGDRRLAQSAQMYHYQHQKQQIIAMERAPPGEPRGSLSEAESDEENEEGDYTVYECPGLAPTGEMEVKNPLFQDDPTPALTPATKYNKEEK